MDFGFWLEACCFGFAERKSCAEPAASLFGTPSQALPERRPAAGGCERDRPKRARCAHKSGQRRTSTKVSPWIQGRVSRRDFKRGRFAQDFFALRGRRRRSRRGRCSISKPLLWVALQEMNGGWRKLRLFIKDIPDKTLTSYRDFLYFLSRVELPAP